MIEQTHLFSLYTPNLKLESWIAGQVVQLQDQHLIHRMIKVLRFDVADQCLFFDVKFHARVVLQQLSKINIIVQVLILQTHQPLQPNVTFFLPLLKKEALERAVYSLCELGVNSIQLIITQKSRQSLMHEKEFVRLQSIVIAAAEQSKNYALSKILLPKKLTEIIDQVVPSVCNIVFDPAGVSFFSLQKNIASQSVGLLVGPEGGLTLAELQQAQKVGFVSSALTPTILTAVQAVTLGAGLIRLKK